MTAKAFNTLNIAAVSAPVTISVVNLSAVTVTPSIVGTNQPATITVSGGNPCGALQIDFGDGSAPVIPIPGLPYSTTHAWTTGGTKTIVVTGQGDCAGQVSTTVTVVANTPPTVTLTSPANGSAYAGPATVALQASASDSDGTVARVEFFAGTTLLGTDTSTPYAFTWSNVADGSYSLTAQAIDNFSARTISAPVSITVSNRVTGVSLSPSAVVTGQPSTATVIGSPGCTAVGIDFGAGSTQPPQVYATGGLPFGKATTWTTAGTKTVLATGQSDCGGQASATIAVDANPLRCRSKYCWCPQPTARQARSASRAASTRCPSNRRSYTRHSTAS